MDPIKRIKRSEATWREIFARHVSSGLSVLDFVKGVTVQELSPAGLRALGPTAVTLAELEGLDAHANAVTLRLGVLEAEADASARPRAQA